MTADKSRSIYDRQERQLRQILLLRRLSHSRSRGLGGFLPWELILRGTPACLRGIPLSRGAPVTDKIEKKEKPEVKKQGGRSSPTFTLCLSLSLTLVEL